MQNDLKKSKSRVVIGEYQMIKLLGEGTTAKVFLAQHNSSKALIAIKRIRIDFINENASNREYFFNELQIMNKLKHPNLLHCYELYQTTSNFYILMEYCDGGSLKHLRGNQGGLTEEASLVYMKQIMEGFKALKRHKIIHRDVKLENLLIKDNILKIADFGTAKRGMESTSTKMIGSFLTMAPEVMQVFNDDQDEDSYSSKVDLWSIGVVFYEILFGQSPFYGNYPAQMIHSMKNNSGDNLKLPKEVSPEMKDLLTSLLQFNPKNRISWEGFFKHAAFNLFPLPPSLDSIYKDYKISQFDKGNRLRKGSKRIKTKKKPSLNSMPKSVSKNPKNSSSVLMPKPMKTIENLSNIYKSKEKMKKNSSKTFKTSILNSSNGGHLHRTGSKQVSTEKRSRERFSSIKLSKHSTQKSNNSNIDKNSTNYSRNRMRSNTDQASTSKNPLVFSKVSNAGAKSPQKLSLQHSETLPFQRNSLSTQLGRAKKKFQSIAKNSGGSDISPEKYSKSSMKTHRKKKNSTKKSKSSVKTTKSKKRLKKSGKLGDYSSLFQKSKSSVRSKQKIQKSVNDSQIEAKKKKLLKKYKLAFQMRLISNRYFHEKNKILFINITLKNIRDVINRKSFKAIESNLYICVIYLMKKAIYLSGLVLKSLQYKRNIFNIDFFKEYTESKNHIEMIREYSEDWTSCKNYFSIFIERIRSKQLPYYSRLEEHIEFLSKKVNVTPSNLHQMLETQFSTLIDFEMFNKSLKGSNENSSSVRLEESKTPQSTSPVQKSSLSKKKKIKLETDFYKMMVQLKYSIFTDESFPYVIQNNFFDWKDFFNKFQAYKKDALKKIIKSN